MKREACNNYAAASTATRVENNIFARSYDVSAASAMCGSCGTELPIELTSEKRARGIDQSACRVTIKRIKFLSMMKRHVLSVVLLTSSHEYEMLPYKYHFHL